MRPGLPGSSHNAWPDLETKNYIRNRFARIPPTKLPRHMEVAGSMTFVYKSHFTAWRDGIVYEVEAMGRVGVDRSAELFGASRVPVRLISLLIWATKTLLETGLTR